MRRILIFWSMLFLVSFSVFGCVTAGVVPVVTEVVTRAYEDRTAEQQITDAKIHTRILNFLIIKGAKLPIDVNTDVWQRRVMLTGTLDDPKIREYMANRIRDDGRVRAFYNHIEIVPSKVKVQRTQEREPREGQENGKVNQAASDFWINAKIKAQLIAAEGVKSVNYRWQSVLNRVYVIGFARTLLERDKVLKIIRRTKGVNGVKGYIEVPGRK